MQVLTISIWLNFGGSAPPGRGSASGAKIFGSTYYSQRAAVCVSERFFHCLCHWALFGFARSQFLHTTADSSCSPSVDKFTIKFACSDFKWLVILLCICSTYWIGPGRVTKCNFSLGQVAFGPLVSWTVGGSRNLDQCLYLYISLFVMPCLPPPPVGGALCYYDRYVSVRPSVRLSVWPVPDPDSRTERHSKLRLTEGKRITRVTRDPI